MVALAKEKGFEAVFVPAVDANEAALVDGANIIPADSLGQLVSHPSGDIDIPFFQGDGRSYEEAEVNYLGTDMAYTKGSVVYLKRLGIRETLR